MLDRKIGEIAGSRLYARNLEFRLADHGTGSICYTAVGARVIPMKRMNMLPLSQL